MKIQTNLKWYTYLFLVNVVLTTNTVEKTQVAKSTKSNQLEYFENLTLLKITFHAKQWNLLEHLQW